MFGGIITKTGKVARLREQLPFFELCVECDNDFLVELESGASVAVNGVCLTLKVAKGQNLYFDLSRETLQRTTLGRAKIFDAVNLERALRCGEELGGHLLSGHVDIVGRVEHIFEDERGLRFEIGCERAYMKYVLQKGSIAIDGVSLTINNPAQDSFFVYIIPETLRRTIFFSYKVGDCVNIEFDKVTQTIVDTLERCMENK